MIEEREGGGEGGERREGEKGGREGGTRWRRGKSRRDGRMKIGLQVKRVEKEDEVFS